jgi:hypothetical protein
MKERIRVSLKLKRYGWLTFLFFVMTFAIQSPLQASASNTICQVEYINDRLTISVDHVALGLVLEAIREKTGVEFVLSQELSEVPISIQLGPLPVAEGLKRILGHFNHAFILGADQKLIKIIILGYAKLNNFPWPREAAETPSVRRVISPSSTETKDIKQPTKEGSGVTFGEGVITKLSPEMTFRERSSGEEMVVTPSTETMVIHPPPIDMNIKPSFETMVIKPASVNMVVRVPTGTMTSLVENMIIRGSTGASNPNFR